MAGGFSVTDKRWVSGVFRPKHSKLIGVFVATVIFSLISCIIIIKRPDILRPPLRWENLFGLFILMALITFVCFLKAALRTWKFRGSQFKMDVMPGVIGGKFAGVLTLPALFDSHSKVRVEIVNEKSVTRRSSGKSGNNTSVERYYCDSENIDISQFQQDRGFVYVPVEFTIPYDTKDETDDGGESSKRGDVQVRYRWLLKAKADISGADLDLVFTVPIYRTEESDPEVGEPVKDSDELENNMAEDGGPKRIQVVREFGVNRYITKAWPGFINVLMLLIVWAAFTGFGAFLMRIGIGFFHDEAETIVESIFNGIFTCVPIIFSLILFGVGFLVAIILMQSLSRKETWVDFGYLHHSGRFIAYSWKKKIELARIEDVVVEKSGHSGEVDFYRVVVKYEVDLPNFVKKESSRNKQLYVADYITSKTEAKWLKEELLGAVLEKV